MLNKVIRKATNELKNNAKKHFKVVRKTKQVRIENSLYQIIKFEAKNSKITQSRLLDEIISDYYLKRGIPIKKKVK